MLRQKSKLSFYQSVHPTLTYGHEFRVVTLIMRLRVTRELLKKFRLSSGLETLSGSRRRRWLWRGKSGNLCSCCGAPQPSPRKTVEDRWIDAPNFMTLGGALEHGQKEELTHLCKQRVLFVHNLTLLVLFQINENKYSGLFRFINPRLGPLCVEFACSPRVCVRSLRVLRLPPTVHKHAC